MSARPRRMTAVEVESLLRRYGFSLRSQTGSHREWRHLGKGLVVVVPAHKGSMKAAKIPESEWRG